MAMASPHIKAADSHIIPHINHFMSLANSFHKSKTLQVHTVMFLTDMHFDMMLRLIALMHPIKKRQVAFLNMGCWRY